MTILLFILLLGLLVLVHEWGHFIVARRLGVRVEEFAFGFPPRLVSFTRRGTRYAFNLFPLGGYVKIFGEGGASGRDPESFSSRSLGERLAIISAGVVMNLALAWFLFSLGHGVGLPTVVGDGGAGLAAPVTIVGVGAGSPAERAGLAFGDVIEELKVQGQTFRVASIDEVQQFISQHRGEEILLTVRRSTTLLDISVVPRREPPAGEGPLGIAMARVGVVRSPWWRAPWDGLRTTLSASIALTAALGRVVGDFVSEGKVPADISGPVGILAFAHETRRLGLVYLLELAGVLSVNLALLNILPIPALDGGRILFLFIEGVRGVRVNQRVEQAMHTLGFMLLLLLMALVTFRDLVRIF